MEADKENQPPTGYKYENLQQLKERVQRLRQGSISTNHGVNNHHESFVTTPLTRLENSWRTNNHEIPNGCTEYPSTQKEQLLTPIHEDNLKDTYKEQNVEKTSATKNSYTTSSKKTDKNILIRNKLVQIVRENPNVPESWLKLLQHVQKEHEQNPSHLSTATIMQLYEKAVRTIPLKGNRKNEAYIQIWVDYAILQGNESEHDARGTFKYMRAEHIGEGTSTFLRAWADFEACHGNHEKAKKLLEEIRNSFGSDSEAAELIGERQNTQKSDTELARNQQTQHLNRKETNDKPIETQRGELNRTLSPRKNTTGRKKNSSWKTPLLTGSGSARRVSQQLLDSSSCTETDEQPYSAKNTYTEWHPSFQIGQPSERRNKTTEFSHCTAASFQDSENTTTLPKYSEKSPEERKNKEWVSETPTVNSQQHKPTTATRQEATAQVKPDSPEILRSESVKHSYFELSPLAEKNNDKFEASRTNTVENKDTLLKDIPLESNPSPYMKSHYDSAVKNAKDDEGEKKAIKEQPIEKGNKNTVSDSSKSESAFPLFSDNRKLIMVKSIPYIPLQVVGKGGSSKVFKVMNGNGQIFALKRVKVSQTDEQGKSIFQNYKNEVSLLQRLKGKPCIIQLIDSEINDKNLTVQFILEYGDIDLSRLLTRYAERQKSVDLNFVRLYWQQMLEAVQTIHDEKIIHSDLKPANFLFVEGTLKLIDFGIAKASQSETTKVFHDSPMGTLNFMSPESFSDNCRLGRASDVWSLGCILYQMVYGKTPFAHLNPIMKMRCIPDPKYPVEFPNEDRLNPHLLDVLTSCLQKDPSKRALIPILLNHPFLHPDSLYSGS
eukprot:jgi/Galph1/4983/GphlegSOOS_G3611.1